MEEKTSGIEVRISDLWSILKKCWWIMAIILVVVFVSMYIFETATYEEEYTATAIVWALGSNASSSAGTSTSDVSIGSQLIEDYKQLIITDNLLQEVIEKEALLISKSQLRQMITVSHEEGTRVMRVSVTTAQPTRAVSIADTLVEVFCDRVNDKNAGSTNSNPDRQQELITVWGYANEPKAPSNSISIMKIALLSAVCAFAVYLVYFVIYIMDDKINNAEDVEKYLGLSMLGMIPNRQDVMRRKKKGVYGYGYYEQERSESANSEKQGGKQA